jgi:spore coat protein A
VALNRRDVLRMVGGGAIGLPLVSACESIERSGSTGAPQDSRASLPEPFVVPLPVPRVLKPVRSDATSDYYEITQRVGSAEILPGLPTPIWGYNGIFPGPTIETRRGRRTVVRHRNELLVPVVVHLHGGVTPPEHDGYPRSTGAWSASSSSTTARKRRCRYPNTSATSR